MNKKSRQKLKYLENEKSFYDEIKSIFHHFYGLSFKQIKQFFLQGEWVFRFIILLTHHCIHFFVPSVQAYFLGSNYCVWKSSKSLKTRLPPSTNWFRLFCFHEDPALPKIEQYLLFWMEIQNLEGRTKCVNAEKRAHFHFQLHVLLSIYIPFSCTQHSLWKVSDLVYDVFFSRILKIWTL